MLKAISAHKDFGKRNPVDIGIECGYTKEDVLDMIQMIQSKKNSVQENESSTKEDKNDREEYYFLFHRGSEEDAYIVSLDINNWSTKIVKVIESFPRVSLCLRNPIGFAFRPMAHPDHLHDPVNRSFTGDIVIWILLL